MLFHKIKRLWMLWFLQNEQLMKQNTELTNTIKEIVPKIGKYYK